MIEGQPWGNDETCAMMAQHLTSLSQLPGQDRTYLSLIGRLLHRLQHKKYYKYYITGSNLHTCKLTLAQAKFNLLVLKWIISHPHFCYHSMCSILALGAHKGWLCVIFSGSVMDRTLMLILSGLQAFLLIIAFTSSASAAAVVTVGSFTTAFKHEMTVSRI